MMFLKSSIRIIYCQNNPVQYTDPSGHRFFTILCSMVVGAAILATVELIFVEKRDKVDWRAAGFEAGVEALSALGGGVFGKAGSIITAAKKDVAKMVAKTVVVTKTVTRMKMVNKCKTTGLTVQATRITRW